MIPLLNDTTTHALTAGTYMSLTKDESFFETQLQLFTQYVLAVQNNNSSQRASFDSALHDYRGKMGQPYINLRLCITPSLFSSITII